MTIEQVIPSYILLTEQVRHRPLFDRLQSTLRGEWHLLDNKEDVNLKGLIALNPRYIFVPHWSHKIPAEITERFECVMFHMTDLPFGRGGSPLQNLIVRGFKETKLSAFRCVEALDAGAVYNKATLSLLGSAEDIFKAADQLVIALIFDIIQKKLQPKPQCGKVTLFQRRTPEQSNIKALTQLSDIYDYIRMLDATGYPNAFMECEHFKLHFSQAKFNEGRLIAKVEFKELKDVT